MPKISIIIPLYNKQDFIEDTIYCLRAQTFKSFECIIIDDQSTDNSIIKATKAIDGDSRFIIIKNKIKSNVCETRNTGLLYASGDYILFLDADDVISKTCLTERYTTVDRIHSRNIAGCYSKHAVIPENCSKYNASVQQKSPIISFETSYGDSPFVIHSPLTRRDVICGVGGFDEKLYHGAEDFELWVRILRHGFIFIPTNTLNAFYREHRDSLVRRDAFYHLYSALKIQEDNNSVVSEEDFFSIAETKMDQPAWAYALEKRYFNRIFRFLGMQCENDSMNDLSIIAKYLPNFHKWKPSDLSAVDLMRYGIVRNNPYFKNNEALLSIYDNKIAFCITEIETKSRENHIPATPQSSYEIYSAGWQRNIDFIFIPHKDYHVETFKALRPWLDANKYTYVIADCSSIYKDERVRSALEGTDIPHVSLAKICLGDFSPKCIVVFNDWDRLVTRPAMEAAKKTGIVALALVEGIQDYNDDDTGRIRNAYKTCSHVILPCSYDKKYFENSQQYVYDGGIPRISALRKDALNHHYTKQAPIVINSNFTYNVLTDKRDFWVKLAVEACTELDLDYVISKHPADIGDFSNYNVTSKSMYDAIWDGSLFISRFGSGIIESIAMNRPVIYFNPHGEKVDKFKDPLGAYYIATSKDELKEKIIETFNNLDELKKAWPHFLEVHAGCMRDNFDSPIQYVTESLQKALQSIPLPVQQDRKKFGEYFAAYFHRSDAEILKKIKHIPNWGKYVSPKPAAAPAPKPAAAPAPKPAAAKHAFFDNALLNFRNRFKRKLSKFLRNPYIFFEDAKGIHHNLKYLFIFKKRK